jgi:hypothetical protein
VQALDVPALQRRLAADGVKIHMDDAVRGNRAQSRQKKPGSGGAAPAKTDSLAYSDPEKAAH